MGLDFRAYPVFFPAGATTSVSVFGKTCILDGIFAPSGTPATWALFDSSTSAGGDLIWRGQAGVLSASALHMRLNTGLWLVVVAGGGSTGTFTFVLAAK